jgi:hypothetical protein
VVARSIAQAATSIGGLIFDHAVTGWDVTVALDRDSKGAIDDRPIRILAAPARHRPSEAARVFKAHALCGSRVAESGEETFFAMC